MEYINCGKPFLSLAVFGLLAKLIEKNRDLSYPYSLSPTRRAIIDIFPLGWFFHKKVLHGILWKR